MTSRSTVDALAIDPEHHPTRSIYIGPTHPDFCNDLLADQVVTELLYGLQHRTENGTKTSFRIFRGLAVRLLRLGAIRTSDLPDVGLDTATRAVRNLVVTAVADRDCDPLTCWDSDRWSLNSVGHAGAVRFDRITQNWLREAAKHWVFAELPKARSRTAATRMQTHVNAIVRLSASLVRHRDDHGRDLHRLGRHDVVEFLNWMGHLQATGRITRTTRHRECTHIAFVLRRMRSGGLTRPAGPLHGLADDFALEPDDMPAHHRDPASRDLPPEVVTALIDTLLKRPGFSGGWVLPRSVCLGLVGERSSSVRTRPAACCRSWSAAGEC